MDSFGLMESSVLDLKQTSLIAEVKVWEFMLVLIIKMQELLALVSQENDNSPPHYLRIILFPMIVGHIYNQM